MSLEVIDECQAMRQRLEEYIPDRGFTKISILLMGMLGHGKSSLINSCLCVTRNEEYYNEAGSGDSSEPITLETKEYQLGRSLYIVDNRGLNKLNTEEKIEMRLQYSKLRHLGEVKWNRALDEVFQIFVDKMNTPQTEFYVPVLVYSVRCQFSTEIYKELEPFIRQAQEITGIFPIIVLTRKTYRSTNQSVEVVYKDFKRLGANYVICIENYTTTNPDRNDATDKEVMTFLKTCLDEAQRAISRKRSSNESEFLRNAVKQINKSVEQEISQRDQTILKQAQQIQSLEKEIQVLRDRCIMM